MATPSFIFGDVEGLAKNPEELARLRKVAEAMRPRRAPQNVGEGIYALGTGLAGGIMDMKARKGETAGRESADNAFNSIVASLSGAAPDATPSVPTEPSLQSRINQGFEASNTAGDDWLNYANQGAVRNMPLSADLSKAMSFLPDLGVEMKVFSGGQPEKGKGARVGSTRHDHGNAADVFFYKDGRRLDWANKDDLPIFQEIVKRGKKAGLTGFGAGQNYMRPGSMHLGFGDPAVWGAGGKSANAPQWLVDAYNGTTTNAPQSVQRVAQATQATQGGNLNKLIEVANNPFLSEGKRAVLKAMIQQRMQASDPMRQMQLEKGRLELERLRNPVQKPTSAIQEYEYAKAQGFDGSFQDYRTALKKAGATNVNVGNGSPGLGKLSTDYGYVLDPATGQPKIDPETGLPQAAAVPGSPADVKARQMNQKQAQQQELAGRAGSVVLEDIGRVQKKIENSPWYQPTTGFMGNILKNVAGTQAADVNALSSSIRANIGFDRLQQMREASPTGGALGQVSNQELSTLQAVLGNIEQSQSEEQLLYNLDRLEQIYTDIMRKAEAYPNAAQFGFSSQAQETLAPKSRSDTSSVLDKAKAAIAAGAPREAVIKRLQDAGIDTGGL